MHHREEEHHPERHPQQPPRSDDRLVSLHGYLVATVVFAAAGVPGGFCPSEHRRGAEALALPRLSPLLYRHARYDQRGHGVSPPQSEGASAPSPRSRAAERWAHSMFCCPSLLVAEDPASHRYGPWWSISCADPRLSYAARMSGGTTSPYASWCERHGHPGVLRARG